jgi:hypothetical protein
MYLKKIKLNKIKSSYLIEDNDSDNQENVTWSENESNNDSIEDEELDEDDEIVNLEKLNNKKKVNEIKFEIIKDNKNNKSVNVCVSLDLELYNIINIEFLISKEIILKLANQLK